MNEISQLNDSANISVEIIENVRTIQLLTREEYFLSKFTSTVEKLRIEDCKAAILDAIVLSISFASVYLCDFISNGVGIPLIYGGYVTSNGVYIAAMNVTMTSYAIQFASWNLIDILHAKPAAESLIPLIDENIDDEGFPSDETKKGIDKRIDGKLEVRNVSFAYPARPDLKVANGLNLRAEIAQTIALVGPSGGGKSTIIQLLERFYQPQGGNIKIDNTDISLINLQNLRKQMALVGQEPILFSGSISDNISLGIENLSLEEVKEACKMANASNFIERLPLVIFIFSFWHSLLLI
uniref:ABC transmembrane type-1 domain-containing protein n=1 Tax=Panagrolaimus superbus TaxID=310955 RepID=A0A914Y8J8_9BILA